MPVNLPLIPGKTESKIDLGYFHVDVYCVDLAHQADSCLVQCCTLLLFALYMSLLCLRCASHVPRLYLMYSVQSSVSRNSDDGTKQVIVVNNEVTVSDKQSKMEIM